MGYNIISGNSKTVQLATELVQAGYDIKFAVGKWDGIIEPSIIIEGDIDSELMSKLAERYYQECYIHNSNLIMTKTGETSKLYSITSYDKYPPEVHAWTFIGGLYISFDFYKSEEK